jgi:hypothetical protein
VSWCRDPGSGPAQSPGGNPGSPALNPGPGYPPPSSGGTTTQMTCNKITCQPVAMPDITVTGNNSSFFWGLFAFIPGLADTSECMISADARAQYMAAGDTWTDQYQRWAQAEGGDPGSDRYRGGQWISFAFGLAVSGLDPVGDAGVVAEGGINEGVNSVSNIGAGAVVRSGETIAQAEPGSAFSGVYDPESGQLSSYPSVLDPTAGDAPVNAVRMYGGHGQINNAVFGGSDSTVGFTAFLDEDGISMGWRSRSVNVANFGQIEAPMEYRQPIMDILAELTGLPVSG